MTLVKHWWLLLAAIIVLVGIMVGGLLIYVAQGAQGVSRANFKRIEEGMALEEVEVLLGESSFAEIFGPSMSIFWRDGPDNIVVKFDDGKVRGKSYTPGTAWERFKHQVRKRLSYLGFEAAEPCEPF